MAVDILMKVTGEKSGEFKGESQKDNAKNFIDLFSFSFGAVQHGAFHKTGAGGGSGKAEVRDVTVSKQADGVSNALFGAAFAGEHLSKVEIHCRKTTGDNVGKTYYKIELYNAVISAIDNQGAAEASMLTETITFNTASMKFFYAPQKKDGTLEAFREAGVDMATGKMS